MLPFVWWGGLVVFMARSRNIKPGFFLHEELGTRDPLLSLLFAGLWCLADRDGLMEDRPRRIQAELFPYRAVLDINGYLTCLSRLRLIRRYQINGKHYIQVTGFKEHQHPHHTEKSSVIQSPDKEQDVVFYDDLNNVCVVEVKPPLVNGEYPSDSLIPDSLVLIPDSGFLIPDSNTKVKPLAAGSATQPLPKKRGKKEPAPTAETWAAYSAAYLIRYAVDPVRNATVNGQLAQLVARLGAQEAPQVAGWYLSHRNQFYTSCGHSVGILLRDCEKLRTEWATGRQGTHAQAVQSDRTQTNLSAFAPMMAEALEREKLTGGKPE